MWNDKNGSMERKQYIVRFLYNAAKNSGNMLNNLIDKSTILDSRPDLFRNRTLLAILIRPFLRREDDIDIGAFARNELRPQTRLTQIDSRAINLLKQERRNSTVDLELELGRLDDLETTDERIDDDRETGAVIDGDSVGLVRDLDDGLVAVRDED